MGLSNPFLSPTEGLYIGGLDFEGAPTVEYDHNESAADRAANDAYLAQLDQFIGAARMSEMLDRMGSKKARGGRQARRGNAKSAMANVRQASAAAGGRPKRTARLAKRSGALSAIAKGSASAGGPMAGGRSRRPSGSIRMAKDDHLTELLPDAGDLVLLPFNFSSNSWLVTTQKTAGTVKTSQSEGTTTAIPWASFDVHGVRIQSLLHCKTATGTSAPTAYTAMLSALVDGGKSIVYGDQIDHLELISALPAMGVGTQFVPVARKLNPEGLVLERSNVAKATILNSVNVTGKVGYLATSVDLVCSLREMD